MLSLLNTCAKKLKDKLQKIQNPTVKSLRVYYKWFLLRILEAEVRFKVTG